MHQCYIGGGQTTDNKKEKHFSVGEGFCIAPLGVFGRVRGGSSRLANQLKPPNLYRKVEVEHEKERRRKVK